VIILSNTSTIQVSKEIKRKLDAFKEYKKESYAEVIQKLVDKVKEDEESEMELSEETLKDLKEAEEDIRKGRVYTSKQIKKELGL